MELSVEKLNNVLNNQCDNLHDKRELLKENYRVENAVKEAYQKVKIFM